MFKKIVAIAFILIGVRLLFLVAAISGMNFKLILQSAYWIGLASLCFLFAVRLLRNGTPWKGVPRFLEYIFWGASVSAVAFGYSMANR